MGTRHPARSKCPGGEGTEVRVEKNEPAVLSRTRPSPALAKPGAEHTKSRKPVHRISVVGLDLRNGPAELCCCWKGKRYVSPLEPRKRRICSTVERSPQADEHAESAPS
jgi:hypothetical protein